ncbi:MAG: STAS domain-containing protein [Solirubrobacterales bacterium]|nr:STAS domain-containing protein [Solirubrobacterales bacterium]
MTSEPEAAVQFTVHGPLSRADLPGLYQRACAALKRSAGRVVVCEVGGIEADAVAADALARLQLAARRNHCEIRLRGCSRELRELLAMMGLADVLPDAL